MTSYNAYSLKWLQACLVMGLLLLMLPAQAATEAALVLFSHGNVVLTNNSGSYPLEKGASVASGDTVITGEDGRIQMRFSDGGLVSLMPNSRFAVEEYSQPTASNEGSVSVNLLKGGMRALSGSIGKKDQDSYKLKTDVATLGIRGTQFVVVMDGATMRVHVGQGSVALFNDFGELLVPTGRHAEVMPGQAPALSLTAPMFVSSIKPTLKDGDERHSEGNQDSSATSNAVNIARYQEPGLAQGIETGQVEVELDGEKTLQLIAEQTGSVGGGEVTLPDLGDETDIGGGTPPTDPVLPPTDPIENYAGGFASATVGETENPHPIYSSEFETKEPVASIKKASELDGEDYGTYASHYETNLSPQDTDQVGELFWAQTESYVSPLGDNHNVYVWGPALSNLPTTGILSYSLSTKGAKPFPVKDNKRYYSSTLSKFDLSIELGANTKFSADVVATDWAFSQTNVVGSLDRDSGEFGFVATNESNCQGCEFKASGFLSGDQTANDAQVGIVFNFKNIDESEHTGGAVLDQTSYTPNVP